MAGRNSRTRISFVRLRSRCAVENETRRTAHKCFGKQHRFDLDTKAGHAFSDCMYRLPDGDTQGPRRNKAPTLARSKLAFCRGIVCACFHPPRHFRNQIILEVEPQPLPIAPCVRNIPRRYLLRVLESGSVPAQNICRLTRYGILVAGAKLATSGESSGQRLEVVGNRLRLGPDLRLLYTPLNGNSGVSDIKAIATPFNDRATKHRSKGQNRKVRFDG
jgi:hypothetical protein